MATKQRILSTRDAADYLNLSPSTLEKRRRVGMDPMPVKLDVRNWGYDVRELDRYIDQQRTARPRRRGRAA